MRHGQVLGVDDVIIEYIKHNARSFMFSASIPAPNCAAVLAALECVDWVVPFAEDTPERLICAFSPDVLVKGADYKRDEVVGAEFVSSYGGEVLLADIQDGYSTTNTIARGDGDLTPLEAWFAEAGLPAVEVGAGAVRFAHVASLSA